MTGEAKEAKASESELSLSVIPVNESKNEEKTLALSSAMAELVVNINEREHTMLKGKQSSSVPVYPNARNQTENVEPTDKTTFTENYSSL